MKRLFPLFPLFLLGLIAALGLPPFGIWPLTLVSLALFARRFQKIRRKRTGFWAGWMFGFGYFTAGLCWIANALIVHIADFWWALPFALFGLPALLAVFWGFFCIFVIPLTNRFTFARSIALALALVMAEWARATLFTGFPWNQFGLIWVHMDWVVKSAWVFGLEGVSIITVLMGCLLYHYKTRFVPEVIIVTLAALLLTGSVIPSASDDTKTAVYVVQPNIAQKDKWIADKIPLHLGKLINMTAEAEIDKAAEKSLVVWPETAMISNYFAAEQYKSLIDDALRPYPSVTLLSGVLSLPGKGKGFTNALYAYTQRSEEVQQYDKYHLVPFGEYIPFKEYIPFAPLTGIEGFERGSYPQVMDVNGTHILPLVCYEIIFPQYAQTLEAKDVIVNITNDAWYGYSTGPFQHLTITRFRAIEQGIPIIRAANTGISAIIAPDGSYIQKQSLETTGVIKAYLPKPFEKPTIYQRYGQAIFYGLIILIGLGFALLRIQKSA